jgi:hypothetical protein
MHYTGLVQQTDTGRAPGDLTACGLLTDQPAGIPTMSGL